MTDDLPGPTLTDPNGNEHPIRESGATIGRALGCDIVVTSKQVSREHAQFNKVGQRWFVEDLDSTNGTYLNNERIAEKVELRDGDTLTIGEVDFHFHDPDTTVRENRVPELEIDIATGIVRLNRRIISLSTKEYQLLVTLNERRGQIFSKDEIGQAVWPEYEGGGVFDYQIENLVRRLRTRIEIDPANPRLLITVRGLGYKLLTG